MLALAISDLKNDLSLVPIDNHITNDFPGTPQNIYYVYYFLE
jgi:hypothetical protein